MSNYIVMEYLYRDANNFKSFGEVMLGGHLNNNDISRIETLLDSGEFFVAEQLNIPSLYSELWSYSKGKIKADHAFHELVGFRTATEDEISLMNSWGAVDDLLIKLKVINQNWDCALSVHG